MDLIERFKKWNSTTYAGKDPYEKYISILAWGVVISLALVPPLLREGGATVTVRAVAIFIAGYLIGTWTESGRTSVIVSELSELLKKEHVRKDIESIELQDL